MLRKDGIQVLPFLYISPRETPSNTSSWTLNVNVDMITGLSASGGVYGLRSNTIVWIQIVKPFTLEKILDTSLNVTSQGSDMMKSNTSFQIETLSSPIVQAVEGLEGSYRIWLGLDSTTLYMIVRVNGTQVLKSVGMDAQNTKSQVKEEISVQEGDVSYFIVHPRTFDYYFVIGNMVKVYGNDKSFKGNIVPSFPIVSSLEIDNNGKWLYIGGQDDQLKGRLDVFDLGLAKLSKVSSSHKGSQVCGLLMVIGLYLNIRPFL